MFDRITPDGAAWADGRSPRRRRGTNSPDRVRPVGDHHRRHPGARAAVRDIRALLAPAGAAD
ncbi:hypothetical protein JNW88_14670 [Micromonospora sp. ATA32]|nr:hypothetical protein [Micromonospora sp. ATA32]